MEAASIVRPGEIREARSGRCRSGVEVNSVDVGLIGVAGEIHHEVEQCWPGEIRASVCCGKRKTKREHRMVGSPWMWDVPKRKSRAMCEAELRTP